MSHDTVPMAELGVLVEQRTEKVSGRKNPEWPYLGLDHLDSGSPFLNGKAPSSASTSTNNVFYRGDVLFGKLRPYLRKSVGAPFSGYCSTDMLVLQPGEEVDPRYAAKIFQSEVVFARANATSIGTKMPRTSWGSLRSLEVFSPPLPEQRRIAEILDTLDDAIRMTEQVIAKLQQMKQGLLHDLLTRGIDENGELRDPERHPEQFKDSPLGRIPRGWEVQNLSKIADFVTSGSRGWAAYYSEHGALFIRIGNLTREHINLRFDSSIRVKPPSSSEGVRTSVAPGDLLISITADLGIIGLAPEGMGEAYVNQHISLVRLNQELVEPRWIAHYLAFGEGQRQFTKLNDQGAKSGLNLPAVGRLLAAIPPLGEQRRLVTKIDACDDRVVLERVQLEKLIDLKMGLMDDLLTGRVRVIMKDEVQVA